MIFVLDNYDSFTYNLVQEIGARGHRVEVRRNDQITLEGIEALAPSHIVVSPGPGRPEEAGLSIDVCRYFAGRIPLLGVCLGHQALAVAHGGTVIGAPRLLHGKSSPVHHRREGILRDVPEPFDGGRYHSLIVDRDSLPSGFRILAETERGEVMAIQWSDGPAYGVQFHPESVLTPDGGTLIGTFLEEHP